MVKSKTVTLATVCLSIFSAFIFIASAAGQDAASPGAEIYAKHCASCHDKATARMPSRSVLQQRTSGFILRTLNSGIMKEQAASLSLPERMAVSQWLGRTTAAVLDSANIPNPCKASQPPATPAPGSWTSWGGGLTNLRFQPASAAALTAAQAAHLKLKWAFGVPDVTALRSQPAVYAGSVLFGGGATLYSLDASSGCVHWATEVPAAIRSGISIGSPAGKPLAFFGDGAAAVYAVDVATGAPHGRSESKLIPQRSSPVLRFTTKENSSCLCRRTKKLGRDQPGLHLLHFPRQRPRARCTLGQDTLANVHR